MPEIILLRKGHAKLVGYNKDGKKIYHPGVPCCIAYSLRLYYLLSHPF